MLRIAWQWWVYVALISGFLAFSYITRNQPEPRPQLAALFIVTFMVVRAIVRKLDRRQAHVTEQSNTSRGA